MSNEHRERIRLYDRMRVGLKCLESKVKKSRRRDWAMEIDRLKVEVRRP